jgi:hypothetical protein
MSPLSLQRHRRHAFYTYGEEALDRVTTSWVNRHVTEARRALRLVATLEHELAGRSSRRMS